MLSDALQIFKSSPEDHGCEQWDIVVSFVHLNHLAIPLFCPPVILCGDHALLFVDHSLLPSNLLLSIVCVLYTLCNYNKGIPIRVGKDVKKKKFELRKMSLSKVTKNLLGHNLQVCKPFGSICQGEAICRQGNQYACT